MCLFFSTVSPYFVNIHPEDQVYVEGEELNLSCTNLGGPENTYQWLRNGQLLEDELINTLSRDILRADINGGVYTCNVSNPAGSNSSTSNVWTLPVFDVAPDDTNSYIGGSVNFTCRARGYPTPHYVWRKTNGTLPQFSSIETDHNNTSTLTIHPISIGDHGEYVCIAMGYGDVSSSVSAILTGEPIDYFRMYITFPILCIPNTTFYSTVVSPFYF